MAQGDGRPGNAILSEDALESHVLLGKRLIGTSKRMLKGRLGLVLPVPALPGKDSLEMSVAEMRRRKVTHR